MPVTSICKPEKLIVSAVFHEFMPIVRKGHIFSWRVSKGEYVVEAHHNRFRDAKGIVALITKDQGAQFKNVST
jgi:hypothetical protein